MKKSQSDWISLADMMTGLMLVFLLIAVLMVHQIIEQQRQAQAAVTQHKIVKSDLYKELADALESKKDDWGIEITEDLVVRFNNPDVLFNQDSPVITEHYKAILNEFIPLYIGIINKNKYQDSIREVRIEGHTADLSAVHNTYIDTIRLSQDRAREILKYLMSHSYYNQLSSANKDKLIFWFTANGYGLGRAIDENGFFIYDTGDRISQSSRRVEFSIITNAEELLKDLSI